MEQAATSLSKPIPWATLLPALGSVILSVGIAYGTTKFTQGQTQKSIDVLEKQQSETPSRRELEAHIDALKQVEDAHARAQTEQLKDIKDNILELRKEVRERR